MRNATTLVGWSLLLSAFFLWTNIGQPLVAILNSPFGAGIGILYFGYLLGWFGSFIMKVVSTFWEGPPPPPPAVTVFETHCGNYRDQAKTRQVAELLASAAKSTTIFVVNISDGLACCDNPSCHAGPSFGDDASR